MNECYKVEIPDLGIVASGPDLLQSFAFVVAALACSRSLEELHDD